MIRSRHVALLSALVLGLSASPPSQAGVVFNLSSPTASNATASFQVSLAFSGGAGDSIDAINLNVAGSDAALIGRDVNGDLDFSRFTFAPALAGYLSTPFSAEGAALIFDANAPPAPLLPSSSPYVLGTLTVDFSGLEASLPLNVSLSGGDPAFATDATGTLGGSQADSFAAAGLVQFGQPDGVPIRPVPEPSTLTMLGAGGFAIGASLIRRLRRNRPALRASAP